ncbi:N-formylglutamate amidohydrolase [Methylocystis parvus]|uniref:N-formylglutamate amidohydrolase n=1 Tax=Methylocystis parvus TaxID=134 RepID=A0A6B8M944_9HYPH|nr:N-formylglutamate amidohydrolase [Methylocystis parvus]QGM98925.1 N-formylglutamate amidohydrolase [Methylocystis parvus]WBK00720.1 N-formylglutamate amidohydrolase [Methylocystis parvus OBBP]
MNGVESAPGEGGAACEPHEPELTPAFDVVEPEELLSPLVFSSPHSGRIYPARFLSAARLDAASLRRSEDAYVDELFAASRAVGAPMLRALFPRAYLDLNREPYELDPKLFDGPLPSFANARSLRVAAGLGTIPRVVADAREIYAARIPLDEALRRIEALYKPYHATLRMLMERAQRRFGFAVLVDCHSMPSTSVREAARAEKKRIDFVIGDRYGASAAPGVIDGVETRLRARGYFVQRNRPYAGGFITEHFGRPAAGWHALQIEISRGLYMDEATLEKNARFASVVADLSEIVAGLAQDVEQDETLGGSRRMAAE